MTAYTEKLFSYGTLQLPAVQWATFGRLLSGSAAILKAYRLSILPISNPGVIAASGMAEHPVLVYTGEQQDCVEGVVFELSPEELELSDSYESADYKRISVVLNSGVKAWVYVGKS